MKLLSKRNVIAGVFFAASVTSFQNCSRANFTMDPAAAAKAQTAGTLSTVTDPAPTPLGGNDGVVVATPTPQVSPTPAVSPTPVVSTSPSPSGSGGDSPNPGGTPVVGSTPDSGGGSNGPGSHGHGSGSGSAGNGSANTGDSSPNSGSPNAGTPSSGAPDTTGGSNNGHSCMGGGSNNPNNSSSVDTTGLVECEMLAPNAKIILNAAGNFDLGSNNVATRVCMSETACLSLINAYAVQRNCTVDLGSVSATQSNTSQCTDIFPGSRGTCHNAKILSDDQVTSILSAMAKSK